MIWLLAALGISAILNEVTSEKKPKYKNLAELEAYLKHLDAVNGPDYKYGDNSAADVLHGGL